MNTPDRPLPGLTDRLRLDKWLWAARFYKTRGLAADDIDKGRIQVNEQVAKASRELKAGDRIDMRQGPLTRTVIVKALSTVRGPEHRARPCPPGSAVVRRDAGQYPATRPAQRDAAPGGRTG